MEKLQEIPKKKAGRPQKREITPRTRHSQTDKDKAARYYVMGLTLPEISKLLDGTPVRTLEKWQLANKWTSLKSPENIKDKVLQLHEAGKTKKEIAKLIDRDQSTVFRWIKEAKGKNRIKP